MHALRLRGGGGMGKSSITVVVLAGVALALAACDLRPPASAADRERAGALATQAQTQLQSGDQGAALQALDESIRLDPQPGPLRARAAIRMARNEFDGALADMDGVIRSRTATAADFSLRCYLRARGDGLRQARSDCDHAIELDPALASAYGARGIINIKQRRFSEAWEDFNTALRVGGQDSNVAWRIYGRGIADWSRGEELRGRDDIELALHSNPAVAQDFAQFGVGVEILNELDERTWQAGTTPEASLTTLEQYLIVYPNGVHASEARTQIAAILSTIAQEQTAGQASLPGFSLAQVRGPGAADSFGAIGLSRGSWRVAFATDYPSPQEAMRAAQAACNRGGAADCEAFPFRNVCAALALSPERRRGMAWAYAVDRAVDGAVGQCRDNGGRHCVPVHSQCTPTPAEAQSSPAPSP